MDAQKKIEEKLCTRCGRSTRYSKCPGCGNEQYCHDCDWCNICDYPKKKRPVPRKEHGTSDHTGVKFEDGRYEEYHGFFELRRLDRLSGYMHKGLIAVSDEDVIRWFVYDKHYQHALAEFFRYWHDTKGYLPPIYKTMDYQIHFE